MLTCEQCNAAFANVSGEVLSVAGFGAGYVSDLGDGLSTEILLRQTRIRTAYWRLTRLGTAVATSVEHGQRLGGDPIDALGELATELVGRQCLAIAVEPGTGDLLIAFTGDVVLRAFRLRRLFEDWEVTLPDGEGFWSNMVLL